MISDAVLISLIGVIGGIIVRYMTVYYRKERIKPQKLSYADELAEHYVKVIKRQDNEIKRLNAENDLIRNENQLLRGMLRK